eukprot:363970-Chlamydomonas_euryale.AAC.10
MGMPPAALADSLRGLFGPAKNTGSKVDTAQKGKPTRTAKEVILQYYTAYNAGDIATIETLLAEDCCYHDMIYEEPFQGRWAVDGSSALGLHKCYAGLVWVSWLQAVGE